MASGKIPTGVPVLPCLTKSVDWAVRLTETGSCANIIQKYEDNPLLTQAGHKLVFRYSLYLKGVVPLQAFMSQKVLVMSAVKPFTMSEPSLGDDQVHICSQACPNDYYTSRSDSADLTAKAADAIRAVLKAFQV